MWTWGNKSKLAKEIIKYMPKHLIYIELFFGAGGLYFNKPKARFNIVNDNDSWLFNFYKVLITKEKREELLEQLRLVHVSKDIFDHYKDESNIKTDIDMAVQFCVIKRFSFLGVGGVVFFGAGHGKKRLLVKINDNYEMLIEDCQVMNFDFKEVLSKISLSKFYTRIHKPDEIFVYADPPYLGTAQKYKTKFVESDMDDLFELLLKSKHKFMISHNKHPYFFELCKKHNLEIITIKDNGYGVIPNTEVIAMNYDPLHTEAKPRQMELVNA